MSVDNDADLYLFDAAGDQVLFDDDSGFDSLPQINAGDLTGTAGVYFLAIVLAFTEPYALDGSLDTGWYHTPTPFQTGA